MIDLRLWWNALPLHWQNILIDNFRENEEFRLRREIVDIENYILKNLELLSQIKGINCAFSEVLDITPLIVFSELEKIDLGDTLIEDVSPLQAFKNLQKLDLMFCKNIVNISCLNELNNLRMVELTGTSVDSLDVFAQHEYLYKLSCKGTRVSSLEGLEKAFRLHELSISDTEVNDLTPVENCDRLKLLSCRNTKIDETQIAHFAQLHPNCVILY